MSDQNESPENKTSSFADALSEQGEGRQEKLLKAADEFRLKMEGLSGEICDLILAQPPVMLLSYMSAQFHMGILGGLREQGDEYRPDKQLIQKFQLAFEYLHAVWATHSNLKDGTVKLDEEKAGLLFEKLSELEGATMMYCMASSAANLSDQSSSTEFHAKSSWTLMRGHRYQVLEGEFFEYMLAPHDAALREVYSMSAVEIAEGIQSFADAMRSGVSKAAEALFKGMEKTGALEGKLTQEEAIKQLSEDDPNFELEMSSAIRDLLFGGTNSLSRHSKFCALLLEDISYKPGDNDVFFADGPFKGTPMRTLPARVRPGIFLDGEYYSADAQFIRDSMYRSIQRGLIKRKPDYKVSWDNGQKSVTENAYPAIFKAQLADAKKLSEVYYKDVDTGNWAETDQIVLSGDVLLVLEAKAGVMAMHSPATDFDKHERTIKKLIIEAYKQCERFINYLASAPEVPLYNLVGGIYVEIAKIRQRDFRLVLPIGLTVEAFTPFSAMCKELDEIKPILGQHPFISMSVDDLFVLNRFLPTTGELLHYLEVRQQAASIPNAMIYDEIEHLGAYIQDNRFDMTIRDQLKEADMITWDSFGDVVDKHFEGEGWKDGSAPHQDYPVQLAAILEALDRLRPDGWLDIDGHIRNMSGKARTDLAEFLGRLQPTLAQHPIRKVLFGSDQPLQIWLCAHGALPTTDDVQFQAEAGCLAVDAKMVRGLLLAFDGDTIVGARCSRYKSPSMLQTNYPALKAAADKQRARFIPLDKLNSDGKGKR